MLNYLKIYNIENFNLYFDYSIKIINSKRYYFNSKILIMLLKIFFPSIKNIIKY